MSFTRVAGLLIAISLAGAATAASGEAPGARRDPAAIGTWSKVALATPTVVNLRIGRHPDKTRVVLDLTSETDFSYALAADGLHLTVRLPEGLWRAPQRADSGSGLVAGYEFLPGPGGGGELIVTATRPIALRRQFRLPRNGTAGPRLVFDLVTAAPPAEPATAPVDAVARSAPPVAPRDSAADAPVSREPPAAQPEQALSRFDVDERAEAPKETGGEWELSGYVAGELRGFLRHAGLAGQNGARLQPSLILQPEVRYDWNNGDDRITFIPFLRVDAADRKRRHADLRELNWLHASSQWDLRVGVAKVFWGVTESRHLVDIINQTDLVEDIDGEDKLGQPMVNLNIDSEWGTLGLFVLPGFRERTFPGRAGRLRTALPVATDKPVFESGAGRYHVDLAARWSMVLGDWDIGLSHFWGTGREPRLVPGIGSGGRPALIPHYDLINQTGLDLQVTKGPWLWKLEAMTRGGQGKRFAAAVPGVEYTLYDPFGGGIDLGLLAEYLYDGRDATAPPTPYDDDFFAGARLTFNDVQSTSVLAGAVVDRNSQATMLSVEAKRRLMPGWTAELEARFFVNVPLNDPAAGMRDDHHIQVTLFRYF